MRENLRLCADFLVYAQKYKFMRNILDLCASFTVYA